MSVAVVSLVTVQSSAQCMAGTEENLLTEETILCTSHFCQSWDKKALEPGFCQRQA